MQEDNLPQKLDSLVKQNRIVLFMKGSASFPVCGMSSTVRFILKKCKLEFVTVDLLLDPTLHSYLKERFDPVTAPYLFIDGRFFGSYDKIIEMYNSGKLQIFLSGNHR